MGALSLHSWHNCSKSRVIRPSLVQFLIEDCFFFEQRSPTSVLSKRITFSITGWLSGAHFITAVAILEGGPCSRAFPSASYSSLKTLLTCLLGYLQQIVTAVSEVDSVTLLWIAVLCRTSLILTG